MAKKKITKMPNYSGWTLEELAAERRRMAMQVNKQMQRFEKALPDVASAYSQYAKPYLRQYGRKTFSTAKNPMKRKTEQAQIRAEKAELAAMNRILQSKTHTITGYKEAKENAVKGLAKAAGLKPRSKAYKSFLSSGAADKILKSDEWKWLKRTSIGSPLLLEITRRIAQGNATPEEVLSRLNDMQIDYGKNEEFENLAWEDIIEYVFDDFIEF